MDDNRVQKNIVAASVESGKAMGSATKDGKKDGEAELYKLNQVWYRMPPTLSLVSKRTITRCSFQQIGYNNPLSPQIASCIFNTGEFYVSGRTSYLVIQAGINKDLAANAAFLYPAVGAASDTASLLKSGAHALLPPGGIMSIFEEITFLSASGTEVDRQQNKGLQHTHVSRNRLAPAYFNTIGELQGYIGGTLQDNYDTRGWSGFEINAAGGVWSAHLLPLRGESRRDYSTWAISNQVNNAAGNNARNRTIWTNTNQASTGQPSYVGSVDVSYDPSVNANYNTQSGNQRWFIVPLSDVLGMFNPYMNALIPASMLAGGRIDFRFKNMVEALTATGGSFNGIQVGAAGALVDATSINNASNFLNTLQINNIYFLLDSFQMNEGVLSRLNEAAATNEGLSVMFDTWDWAQTQAPNLSFEAQVSQARSRISRSFCVIRDQLIRSHPYANSLASEAAVNRPTGWLNQYGSATGYQQLVANYQAVLGSMYFPQQPLVTVEEQCMNSFYVFCRGYQNTDEVNSMSLSDFMGANGESGVQGVNIGLFGAGGAGVAPIPPNSLTSWVQPTAGPPPAAENLLTTEGTSPAFFSVGSHGSGGYMVYPWAINWGGATYGFLAERSQLLQLSGLPISNARLLRHRFNCNYNSASGTGRTVDVFTEYTRVAKVFLGGRIVMRE